MENFIHRESFIVYFLATKKPEDQLFRLALFLSLYFGILPSEFFR